MMGYKHEVLLDKVIKANDKKTYKDILKEFTNKFPNAEVEDYRPACGGYLKGIDSHEQIPNAIIVWLKDGGKIVYISKDV